MRRVRLREVASINPRGDEIALDADVSFVGMAQVNAETGVAVLLETRTFRQVANGYTTFRNEDLLAAKITPCWENGKVARAAIDCAVGVGSTEFHVLRAGSQLDSGYLLHFLRQPGVRAAGEVRMTGSAGQKRVPVGFLEELLVPLPPIAEQRRIAAILDQADAIRAKRRGVYDNLTEVEKSAFLACFGGTPAMASVAAAVESGAAKIRTGPFGSQLLHSEFVTRGVAVLGLDNVVGNNFTWTGKRFISPEKYRSLLRYTVHPGDVLISIMGTVGHCVVVPEGIPTAINTKHICAITPDPKRVEPEFLRACFLWHPEARAHLRRHTKGAIMDGLNMGIIRALPIPVPTLARQAEFVARLTTIRDLRSLIQRLRDADDAMFASLQARAFRGEL